MTVVSVYMASFEAQDDFFNEKCVKVESVRQNEHSFWDSFWDFAQNLVNEDGADHYVIGGATTDGDACRREILRKKDGVVVAAILYDIAEAKEPIPHRWWGCVRFGR